jgi:hypothetical protein
MISPNDSYPCISILFAASWITVETKEKDAKSPDKGSGPGS